MNSVASRALAESDGLRCFPWMRQYRPQTARWLVTHLREAVDPGAEKMRGQGGAASFGIAAPQPGTIHKLLATKLAVPHVETSEPARTVHPTSPDASRRSPDALVYSQRLGTDARSACARIGEATRPQYKGAAPLGEHRVGSISQRVRFGSTRSASRSPSPRKQVGPEREPAPQRSTSELGRERRIT
jgi:hypothetical protein